MKRWIKRLLLGKPLLMSVYEDKFGNKYGGTIHKENVNVVDFVEHIKEPKFLGKFEIY